MQGQLPPLESVVVPEEHQPLRQPPLAISHLLLWTLGSAIILSVTRVVSPPETSSEVLRILEVVSQVFTSGLYGIKLAALFVFMSRAVMRSGPLPREPGHWLLFNGGVMTAITWLAYWLLIKPIGNDLERVLTALGVLVIIVYGATCVLSLAAIVGLFGRKSTAWQFLFGYIFLISLISALLGAVLLSEVLPAGGSLAFGSGTMAFIGWNNMQLWVEHTPVFMGLCGLLLWDLAHGRKRDWLHYAGASSEMGMLLLLVAMHVAQRILR